MTTLHHQHHHRRRLLDEPSDPQHGPTHLDRVLSVCFATVFCVALVYLLLSSTLNCMRRYRRQRRSDDAATTSDATPDPACAAQLHAMPVVVHSGPGAAASSGSSEITEPETCSVCLAEYEAGEVVRVLPRCGHAFHRECIDQWLVHRSSFCPICRDRAIDRDVEPDKHSCLNSVSAHAPGMETSVQTNFAPQFATTLM